MHNSSFVAEYTAYGIAWLVEATQQWTHMAVGIMQWRSVVIACNEKFQWLLLYVSWTRCYY